VKHACFSPGCLLCTSFLSKTEPNIAVFIAGLILSKLIGMVSAVYSQCSLPFIWRQDSTGELSDYEEKHSVPKRPGLSLERLHHKMPGRLGTLETRTVKMARVRHCHTMENIHRMI
jgi:hypothetical protein